MREWFRLALVLARMIRPRFERAQFQRLRRRRPALAHLCSWRLHPLLPLRPRRLVQAVLQLRALQLKALWS